MSLGIYIPNQYTKLLLHLDGNCNDASGNGNNGTPSNITFNQSKGRFNSGVGLIASYPSYISCPPALRISGDFTFSCWFNTTTVTPPNSEAILFGDWGGGGLNCQLELYNAGFRILSKNFILYTYNNISINTWYHFVFTRNSTTICVYLNGILLGTNTSVDQSFVSTNNVKIGSDPAATVGYAFNGSLDEIIVETRTWDARQVAKYFTMSKGRFGII